MERGVGVGWRERGGRGDVAGAAGAAGAGGAPGRASGPRPEDREAARRWARALLDRDDWVILDTETTGVTHRDEVVQIGVVAPDGRVLLDTLLRPQQPIPPEASRVHGIADADVAGAPAFAQVRDPLQALLRGRTVVAYNAAFDQQLLVQTAIRHRVPVLDAAWQCAMKRYSQFVGEWSARYGSYRWQPLPRRGAFAGRQHQAVADCLATRDVLVAMAAVP